MINIALCFDNNFVFQAEVLISSICVSNSNNEIKIFAVSESLSKQNQDKILNAFSIYKNISFEFINPDLSKISDFPIRTQDHVSLATYYRLLLPELLPETIHKILYLDCDMLVVDDIKEFYETDISEFSTAITADMFYDDESITSRLLYNVKDHYYNAGMLLMNLDYWRKNKYSIKTIDFISKHKDLCLAHDQDAINAVLHGTILTAPARYNIQLDFLKKDYSNMVIKDKNVLEDALSSPYNPCVIHFTGPSKPWKYQCFNPYEKLWTLFKNKTDYSKNGKTHEFSGKKLFRWEIKHFLEITHLRHKRVNEYQNMDEQIKKIQSKFFNQL